MSKYNVKCPDGSTVTGTLKDGIIQTPTFAILLAKAKEAGYSATAADSPKAPSAAPISAAQSNATEK